MPQPVPLQDKQDLVVETDLLVIGAGAAGMTAAVVAAREGLQVVLCEKSGMVGGTTSTSAGAVWIPGSSQSKSVGISDSIDAARIYLDAILGAHAQDERLDAYLRLGPTVLDYLEMNTSVRFVPQSVHPDYKAFPGAALRGRALNAAPFDGRKLGFDFNRLRPPRREFMVLGGMMVGKNDIEPLVHPFRSFRNFAHALRILMRHAVDRLRFARGTRLVMGNALAARLLYDLRRTGIDLRLETSLEDLIVENDGVTGAVLKSNSQEVRVLTRKGVVLATGGIGWSAELRKRLLPTEAQRYSLAVDTNTGDGILAAERIQADVVSDLESPALWMPSSVLRQTDGSVSVFPHIILDRAKPGLLAVDKSGRRFVNEADLYHDFVSAMLHPDSCNSRVPSFLICDAKFIFDYGLGLIRPGTWNIKRFVKVGYLARGETVEQLGKNIGVDGAELRQTIERYNRYAETGIDEEFGRGESDLNRFNGDSLNKPNPCLRMIGPGPFYGVAVWPADLASSAGLRTDLKGRVLTPGGKALTGLYAAGNDSTSIFRGTYPGPGTMLGPAIVFGWCAAMDAAGTFDDYFTRRESQPGRPH